MKYEADTHTLLHKTSQSDKNNKNDHGSHQSPSSADSASNAASSAASLARCCFARLAATSARASAILALSAASSSSRKKTAVNHHTWAACLHRFLTFGRSPLIANVVGVVPAADVRPLDRSTERVAVGYRSLIIVALISRKLVLAPDEDRILSPLMWVLV